jgi:hypothetical protein
MKVIIREVVSEDWHAIYINDKKVLEDHNIGIQDVCEELQKLITHNGDVYQQPDYITSIKGEHYWMDECDAEEYGFPEKFSDIPEDILV